MLSDEERKAVDKIKTLIQYLNVWKENFTIVPEDVKYLVTILNLIEKQSKEIEELKEKNKLLQENYSSAHEDINWFCENYISKDKIKAIIEEIKSRKITNEEIKQAIIEVLQSLLEKE